MLRWVRLGRINWVISFFSLKYCYCFVISTDSCLLHLWQLYYELLQEREKRGRTNVALVWGDQRTSASEHLKRPRKSQAMTERRWLGNDNNDAYSGDDNSEQERGGDDPNNNDGAGWRKNCFLKRLTIIASYLRNDALFGGLADEERTQIDVAKDF